MQTVFENQFTCTQDYYKEFYKYICFKRPIIRIINILYSINFISNILSIILFKLHLSDVNMMKAVAGTANLLVVLGIETFCFFRSKNRAYNRDMEINKGKPFEIKTVVTEHSINISSNSEKDTNIEFVNIKKVVRTKNYYILFSKAGLVIALTKDGFIKGTAEEFEEFLKQKKLLK